jgi:hypothetical protein
MLLIDSSLIYCRAVERLEYSATWQKNDMCIDRIKLKDTIRIKVISWIRICVLPQKLDPDQHEFADDKPTCMEYEPI